MSTLDNLDFEPKFFDPRKLKRPPAPSKSRVALTRGEVYVYKRDVVLAVNAALATRRPLLVAGPPGSGKSTLARHVAAVKDWSYGDTVVTSRTQANDFLWTFDALQRLRDAQARRKMPPAHTYLEPGILWWALSPSTAKLRGQAAPDAEVAAAKSPLLTSENREEPGVVVLIDEIDKADPDVPNDMLGPLGTGTFRVKDNQLDIDIVQDAARTVLVVLTTNRERELSQAFLRRCIYLELPPPDQSDLVRIAEEHFGAPSPLHAEIATAVVEARKEAETAGARGPSTAEFLDAVAACANISIGPRSTAWERLRRQVLAKFLSQAADVEKNSAKSAAVDA